MKINKIILFSALGLLLSASTCLASWSINNDSLNNNTGSGAGTAYEPVASPVAGAYTSSQSVSLSASGANSIRYTIDGTSPSCTSGTVYSSAITVNSNLTLKAISCYTDNGGTSASNVSSHAYTFSCPTVSNAATYNSYPTCGPATCNSGYSLSGSSCVANSSGGGGGGGGGSSITYCATVTYSSWQACIGGLQSRTILTNTPASCTLTTAQQLAASRVCELATTTEPIVITTPTTSTNPTVISQDSSIQTASVMAKEKKLTIKIDSSLIKRLAGRILLQTEQFGQAWYLDIVSLSRFYLADGPTAYEALRKFGLGISNANLNKIPVASGSTLPTGYVASKSVYSTSLVNRLKGRIVIQVENHGEAWYINPTNGQRYYLANGEAAYQIMRNLSLGISDINIHKITVGSWE
jgi:hypothetical protein